MQVAGNYNVARRQVANRQMALRNTFHFTKYKL